MGRPFVEAMSELGYVEGRNLVIRPAFADGNPERLPGLIAELINAKVDAIVTTGPRETVAAKRATVLIPIVMTVVPDPVAQGFVASLTAGDAAGARSGRSTARYHGLRRARGGPGRL